MGKYTEALRKIEEERKKDESSPFPKSGPHLKRYVIGAFLLLGFILAAAYGYGLRHGSRSPKMSLSEHETVPVSESGDATGMEGDKDLLQNVEKMLLLSYGKDEVSETPSSQPAQTQANYYTVQLAAYQEESRARNENMKLNQEGLDVFILDAGQFYVVCIGHFPDRQQATERLFELKNSTFQDGRYQDAFVRLIKPKS